MTKTQKSIWSLIRHYRFNSIFFSFLKYTLILMIVPFLITTGFMTQNIYSSVKTEAEKKNDQLAERAHYVLDGIFESVNTLYNQFAADTKVIYLLTADMKTADVHTFQQSVTSFYNRAFGATTNGNMFDSIYLYSKRNSYIHSVDSSNYLDRFLYLDWYKHYVDAGQKNIVCSSRIAGTDVVSIVMNIYQESDYSGALVFNVSKNYIEEALNDPNQGDFTFFSFLTSDTNEVYAPKEIGFDEARGKAFFTNHYDFSDFQISYHGFFLCNMTLLSAKRMLPVALPYFILLLFAVIFVAFMCSLKYYKSIANIMTAFENAASGIDILNEDYNELHYINDNIVNMLLHSKQVENDLVMRFSELKKAQSIALQTQLNPHFLFNTLNLVNAIIIEDCGRDTDAVIIVKKLAELLNIALDTKTYTVPVSEELDYAKKYVDIELIRNDYNFIVDYEISPEVSNCKTLKMILQPILENAVFHGISHITDDRIGRIHVTAYIENNTLIFSIKDNGNGIEESTLSSITEKLESDEIVETKHIGIANVNSRIKIVHGKEYGLTVKTSDMGTEVIIRQPLIELE